MRAMPVWSASLGNFVGGDRCAEMSANAGRRSRYAIANSSLRNPLEFIAGFLQRRRDGLDVRSPARLQGNVNHRVAQVDAVV